MSLLCLPALPAPFFLHILVIYGYLAIWTGRMGTPEVLILPDTRFTVAGHMQDRLFTTVLGI